MRSKASGSQPTEYRPDIDGLRAIAILSVVADHVHLLLSGGYVGVDVFFVISGYLISATMLKEMNAGSFSIVSFYERRIRRILPALIVMLLATCGAAGHFLFPTELRAFAGSLLAAIFSFSNIWFRHQGGYFSIPSNSEPLLHTWSLAVEEQYYVLFPLFLLLLRRFARAQLRAALWGVTLLSFALAVYFVQRDVSAAFFLAPLRAWELLIGTIVSQKYLPSLRGAVTRNLATGAGLLLIVVPALRYTGSTPFPGIGALAPCLGAALIIAGGECGSSFVGRLLSFRPLVFVGLISYSVYLWHWPLIAFQNISGILGQFPANSPLLKVEIVAISLLLGTLSLWFVETPFRRGSLRPVRRSLFLFAGAGVLAVTAIGGMFLGTGGLPSRFPSNSLAVAQYLTYDRREPFREGSCFLSSDNSFAQFRRDRCLEESGNEPNVLLYGDSQAAQLRSGLETIFPNTHFLQATSFACAEYAAPGPNDSKGCRELASFMHSEYFPAHRDATVLYASRWMERDLPNLERELNWMKGEGLRVILVGPMIEYDRPFPRLLATALRDDDLADLGKHLTPGPRALDARMERLARERWHVPYVSYYQTLCTPQCPAYGASGVPLMFDEHHLTSAGSRLFAQAVRDRNALPQLQAGGAGQ